MLPASDALKALLASRQFYRCPLYIITLADGTVLRWSGGDCPILADGAVYPCGGMTGPYFGSVDNAPQLHQKLGADVDTLIVDVIPGEALLQGLPWLQAAQTGVLDGAWLELRWAYLPIAGDATCWPLPATGTVWRFSGRVAEIDGGAGTIVITVNSALEALQGQVPREVYQAGCLNMHGDSDCGVDLAPLGVAGTVQAGSDALTILTALPQAAGYFDLGTVSFTSGALAGMARSVRSWVPGTLTLMTPFPAPPQAGDTFTVTPGCDGSLGPRGCARFNNIANFRATPNVPAPSYAN